MTSEERFAYTKKIAKALENAGFAADTDTCRKLSVYMTGILEKNKSINLTRVTEPDDFIQDHIVDSASISGVDAFEMAVSVCDVGTGAGFPGVVIAALYPEKRLTLIDSLAKRLAVIKELAAEAGIDNIRLIHARAEDAGRDPDLRERFDLVTARAVAKLSVLAELALPLVRKGGTFAAFKGASCKEEAKEAEKAANISGSQSIVIQDAGVKGTRHVFAVMKKVRKTPEKYPRKAGEPARKPL